MCPALISRPNAVIYDPREARLCDLDSRFRGVSRRSMRARRLRRIYRVVKLPVLIAAACCVALGFVLAAI
jgi:hypothetical protein